METVFNLLREKFPHLEIEHLGKDFKINGIVDYKVLFELLHQHYSISLYQRDNINLLTWITIL